MKEIGSEFWLEDSVLKKSTQDKMYSDIPFFKFKNVQYTTTGRGAITYIIRSLNLKSKKALLPAYICESVILPFEQHGFEISYYQINEDLTPNFKNIKMDFDVFFHLGYYGFKTNSIEDLPISHSGKNVIEDITHSIFSKNDAEGINDFQIGSIRKWLGIPSGGLVKGTKITDMNLPKSNNGFVQLRKKALVEKNKYINQNSKDKEYLTSFNKAENIIDNDVDAYEIDSDSLDIIRTFDYNEMIQKRRENYQVLLNGITQNKKVIFIFEELPDTVCPMFFPIYVNDRDSLRSFLTKNKIYCPVHWPVPPQVKNTLDETTTYIYNNILSIPCDQRYGMDDMQRIVKVINEWLNQ